MSSELVRWIVTRGLPRGLWWSLFGLVAGSLLACLSPAGAVAAVETTVVQPKLTPLCAAWIASFEREAPSQSQPLTKLTAKERKQRHRELVTSLESSLCSEPGFAESNRLYVASLKQVQSHLDRTYVTLRDRLGGKAREHLIHDQSDWMAYHDREDSNPENVVNAYCARIRYLSELTNAVSLGGYPFISDHVIIESQTYDNLADAVHVDVHYPQFDNRTPGATVLNRSFAEAARKGVAEFEADAATTLDGIGPTNTPPSFEFSQWFELLRPGPQLVNVIVYTSRTPGTNYASKSHLINLRTGTEISLDSVFAPDSHWREALLPIVVAAYDQWDDVNKATYSSAQIAEVLNRPERVVLNRGSLQVLLQYKYWDLDFEVDVPYSRIQSLLRADGPVTISPPVLRGKPARCEN